MFVAHIEQSYQWNVNYKYIYREKTD